MGLCDGRVERGDFVLVSGSEDVASSRASPEASRTFCRRCGSALPFISDKRPDTLSVALGTLDDALRIEMALHIFVASKAPWFRSPTTCLSMLRAPDRLNLPAPGRR